jgi:3-methyladenine DNA glycosylase/8-oxoguanine DNA glycosylase
LDTLGELRLRGGGGEPIDWKRTLSSHGVATLMPNRVDTTAWTLSTTMSTGGTNAHRVCLGEVRSGVVRATVQGSVDVDERHQLLALCRHMLRLDDDLSRFYELAQADPELAWVTAGGGRMLCSPTVFEDVVKTICTTNCSWSGTERMVGALVEHLGCADAGGWHAFPSPQAMAEADDDFYRLQARAGYRGAYLRALATRVAEGEIDLEGLNDPELPDSEAEARLLALPGVGPYAAAHVMLTGLGRYGLFVLDSWTRPAFARLSGRKPSDRAIRRRFRKYGTFQGLAFWLYLTQSWVDD